MTGVIETIKKSIKENDLVRNSVLGFVDQWKQGHYETLSDLINEKLGKKIELNSPKYFNLGNTISAIIPKRLFVDQIKDSASTDLRFLKTLDKISIFFDYKDLNDFISPTDMPQENNDFEEDFNTAKTIINTSCAKEYEKILTIPQLDIQGFEALVFENSPYLKRVEAYLQKLCSYEVLKLDDELSNFEIYNHKLVSAENNSLVISTEEIWNLIFKAPDQYYPYQKKTEQTYFFRKNENGNWLIWDNYNPDIDEILNTRPKEI